MDKFIQIGEKCGLEGDKLLEFVQEQQKLEEEREEKRRLLEEEKEERRRILEEDRRTEDEEKEERRRREDEERENRRQERELRKLEMEAELLKQKEAIEAAKREHELELARLGQGRNVAERAELREDRAKAPKLPSFFDGKDDLDAYLQRFERFATTAKWEKTGWASKLSALLSRRALEVYSRLSEEAAQDYDRVKLALMKRYDLTEDGYRRKFRASKPQVDESPEQFIVRLDRYLLRWLELSNSERSFEGLKDLIVKEQFIDSCPIELAIHLRERTPETLVQIAKIVDQYLQAHGKHLFSPNSRKPIVLPQKEETRNQQNDLTTVVCFKCNARGHRAVNCPSLIKKCFMCGKQGHEARNCRSGKQKSGGQNRNGLPVQRGQVSAGCLVKPPEVKPTEEEVRACIKDDKLLLASGKKIPIVSNACLEPLSGDRLKMPVVKGRVGEKTEAVLRDTGCSGIVVKKNLVSEDQFTGDFNVMLLIDNTARKVPIARITVDTPYLKGQVEAQCLPDAIYDLIIGNVLGARPADEPDPTWQEACVVPISPPSEEGHRYILTLADFATRYPEAVPLKTIDIETVADALVNIFSRLGVPEEILSDVGTQFVSDCMKEVTRLLSIKQITTTPYHPMCNGLTEKFNGTMKLMLKRLCSEQPRQWHRFINPLLFAYREVPQESTGFSPFELLYGRAVRGPMTILKELWTKEVEEPEVKNSYQYVFELREKLEDTLKLAHSQLQKAQDKGKHYYDRKTRARKLQPGKKVLVLLPTDHNKLLMKWKGPFEVSSVVALNDYRGKEKRKVTTRISSRSILKEMKLPQKEQWQW